MPQHNENGLRSHNVRVSGDTCPRRIKKGELKRRMASANLVKPSRGAKQNEGEDSIQCSERIDSLRTLAGGVAHDFNNLLQCIQGQAELVLLTRASDEILTRSMQEIIKAAQRGAEVTRDLLAFSGISEGLFNPIDLNLEILKIYEALRQTLPGGIEIKLNLAAGRFVVSADLSQIRNILTNLAINSRDAMPQGGTLEIRTKILSSADNFNLSGSLPRFSEYGVLSVSDTGHGIDSDIIRHIFDPFYTSKGRAVARGLGLTVVYGLVKNLGGYISCTSEINRGTTFEILLPIIPETPRY